MSENIDVKIVLQAIDKASGDINKVKEISKKASAEIQMAMIKERIRLTELKQANSTLITTTQRLSLEKLKLREATLKATSASKDLKTSKSSLNESILSVKNSVMLLGGYMSGTLLKNLTDTQVQADKFERTLKVASGSTHLAGMEMQFLKDESQRLGLEFTSVASSYAKISASAKISGISTNETREIFLATAEAGASLGLTAYDMEGALNAFQQMISKGNVQAEELRGQLGERIPGAFGMASKAMGVTEKELNKLLETGQVTAKDLLPKLAKEMRATFGAGAVDGAKSLNAEMNRFSNAMFEVKKAYLDSGLSTILIDAFVLAKDAVKSWSDEMKRNSGGSIAKMTGITGDFNKKQAELAETLVRANQNLIINQKTQGSFSSALEKSRVATVEAKKAYDNLMGAGEGQKLISKKIEDQYKYIQALNATTKVLEKQDAKTLNTKTDSSNSISGQAEKDALEKKKAFDRQVAEERSLHEYEIDAIISEHNDNRTKLILEEEQARIDSAREIDQIIAEINEKTTEKEILESEKRKRQAQTERDQKRGLALDTANTVIGTMKLMSGTGKKYALLNKTLAIADIGVNTARSVMQAIASPPGPPWTIPLATAIGAMGAVQIGKASQAKFAAKGADFVTNGPQLMVVGENSGGRERVQVTPLSSPNINGPKTTSSNVSFGNININVNNGGDLISMLEKNPDRFNQLLKNGLKRGAMSGVI